MLQHKLQIAHRPACRGYQGLIAADLSLGQRSAEVVPRVVERPGDPIGFAAPRQGLSLKISVADLVGQPDGFRPLLRRGNAVAGAKGRRPSAEVVEYRAAIAFALCLRGRAGEQDCGEEGNPKPAHVHFSCISVNTPVSPAARRSMWNATQGSPPSSRCSRDSSFAANGSFTSNAR